MLWTWGHCPFVLLSWCMGGWQPLSALRVIVVIDTSCSYVGRLAKYLYIIKRKGSPICADQSREWVTQSDPWPKWPIELLTHDPCDPWPMGHRGRHPILAQALHRFIDYPALYLDTVYVHTPLSCYIIAHVSKLHTQAPVNLEFAKWKLKHCIT